MTLLLDGRPAPPAPVTPTSGDGPDGPGFRDCRGVWQRLDRDEQGGRD